MSVTSGFNPRRQASTTQEYKSWSHGITNVSITEINMLKNSSTIAVSVSITLFIKLGFVPVNGCGETYFVDALRRIGCRAISFYNSDLGLSNPRYN